MRSRVAVCCSWLVILMAALAAGCSGDGGSDCMAGDTKTCSCTGGGTGTQACKSDGSGFDDCVCTSAECSASNPEGMCSRGSTCVDGDCCETAKVCGTRNCCTSAQTCMDDICVTPCSSSNPNGFCGSGMTCAGGTCCATERTCGSTCCPTGMTCNSGTCQAPVCSSANPTGTCEGGAMCIGGACCPTARVCGTSNPTCCNTMQTCTSGMCMGQCVPNCGQAECGPNGCGGQCGAGNCPLGLMCQAGTCTLDGSTTWQLIATSGGVQRKDDWDFGGGAPDPLVCAEVDSAERCTEDAIDTYEPGKAGEWGQNGTLVAEASAAKLQAGIPVHYMDEDVALDDVICESTRSFTIAEFRAGTGKVSCTNPASFWNFNLKPKATPGAKE